MTRHLHNQRGIALLLTLVVLVLLVALIVEFDYGTKVDLLTTINFRDGVQAVYLAKAGVSAARALLKDDLQHPDRYSNLKTQPCLDVGVIPVGDGTASVTICDESAKLSVNWLAKPTDFAKWKPVWERLFDALEIKDKSIISAIKDWVDEDTDPTDPGGAEDDYYERLDPPYRSRNGPIDSLGELRLIKGITDEVYKKLTTGCGGQPCVTAATTNKVNLNTISVQACQALHEGLTEDCCRQLVERRPISDMTSGLPACWGGLGSGSSLSGIRYDLINRQIPITTSSDLFSVRSTGEINGTQQRVEALVDRHTPKITIDRWAE